MIINEFSDTTELGHALLGTGAIPGLTVPGIFREFQDYLVVDGGVTNNRPVFTDSQRDQLVIGFEGLPERLQKMIYFTSEEMFELTERGIEDTIVFLKSLVCNQVDSSQELKDVLKNLKLIRI